MTLCVAQRHALLGAERSVRQGPRSICWISSHSLMKPNDSSSTVQSLSLCWRQHSSRGASVIARFKSSTDSRVIKRRVDLDTRMLYLVNFWYAAAFSKQVKAGRYHRTTLLNTPVLLWRTRDGRVRCVTDKSPSDGRPLSGRFKLSYAHQQDDSTTELMRLACAATYDLSTGERVHGLGSGSYDALAGISDDKLEVWDCVERGGFVWFFFGDPATPSDMRPPIPWVPELSQPGWRPVHGEVTIKANHWMVIENVIDMAHVPYVHAGTVGDHAAFVDIKINTTATALNFAFPIENHHADGESAMFQVDTKATACLPSTSFIRFRLPWNLRLVTINSVVPIDEETTIIRFCQMRNFLGVSAIDPLIRQGMANILGEDRVILEQLRPEEVTTEVSLKADSPQLELRRMRMRYIEAGAAVAPGPRPLHALPRWGKLSAQADILKDEGPVV